MIEEKWRLDISPRQAAQLLDEKLDAECVCAYELNSGETDADSDAAAETDADPDTAAETSCCVVRIYEKWFGLTGARASLTVTLDNFGERTRVKFTAAGGTRMPRGRLDWGTRTAFEKMAKDILSSHRVMP